MELKSKLGSRAVPADKHGNPKIVSARRMVRRIHVRKGLPPREIFENTVPGKLRQLPEFFRLDGTSAGGLTITFFCFSMSTCGR